MFLGVHCPGSASVGEVTYVMPTVTPELEMATWYEAAQYCGQLDLHLPTIHDANEKHVLTSFANGQ